MKNMKKLTAMLLTLVMSLALAVPCFAAAPREEPEENAIYLEAGDTVTIDGITVSLQKVDEAAPLSAARTTYTYIAPTTTWTQYAMYSDSGTCKKINGDSLGFGINNRTRNPLELQVWVNLGMPNSIEKNFYCTVNGGPYEFRIDGTFQLSNSVQAEWTVSPTASPVNFTISAYQFWSFDV